jgi:hypothetical protein
MSKVEQVFLIHRLSPKLLVDPIVQLAKIIQEEYFIYLRSLFTNARLSVVLLNSRSPSINEAA